MAQEESSVVKVICDHLGCMEHDELLQRTAVEDVDNVLKNSDIFTVIQENKSKKILVTTRLRRCRTAECQESCTHLHLCKFDLLGQCNTQRCKYGHSLESEHNSRVLLEHGLQDLSKDHLRVLLLQNDNSLLPNVCVSYNKGSGEFGNCPEKEVCNRLHVCEKYLRGLCDGRSECNRCHDFYEPHPMKTLQARGLASQLVGSLLMIYRNILTLKDHRNARDKPGARSKEISKSSSRAKVPESVQRRAENVICLSFIRGTCKYEDKCWRVHFGLPYKWEVKVDEVWIDLPDNEVIERDYSDPAKIHSVGAEPVCFDTMMQGVDRVRRLSTVSSVIEPSFSHTTKWIWYWQNEYNTWIQYGSVKEMHRLSTITSEELEKQYLQFLEDNTHDVVKFTAGKQCYELNFRDMKQRNEWSSTERAVGRRPFFVSLFDVQRTNRRGPMSSSHRGVPGFWDKTAVPESGFQRVLLNTFDKDYVRVQEHFSKTMKDFSISTIERVQNKELWEDFQTKRERMKRANSHKKYKEAERLLFHGTNAKNIDAICHQNFDMRVSGANATVYGQGSYFARDAKYSHDYTDHYGDRSMFACRVLVGQYTKGASHYRRPPAKDAAGNLYDSCVNDVREPSIYVVFERSQVYPEFLITYEKSRFPNDIQSNRTANLSEHPAIFDYALDRSQTASSTHQANNVTSGCSTGGTLATVSTPTMSSVEFAKSVPDTLDPFSFSSDKIKIFDASPTTCLSDMESKTSVPYKTSCSSAHKQLPSESSWSGSLVSFNETLSSEKASQRFNILDDVFNVSQTASEISTSSPHKAYCISSGSTCTGEEFLPSKPAQGLTSLSYTGLPSKSTEDLLTSGKIPVSSHSDNQPLISDKPSLTDRSMHSKLRPNPDFVATQRSQSWQQDSQKQLSARTEVVSNFSYPLDVPSSTAWARNHSSVASSASSHSAKKSEHSVIYKTSSSSTDKQSRSDDSLSRSSVSFYDMQARALSSMQTPPKSVRRQQASHLKDILETQSEKEKCVVM